MARKLLKDAAASVLAASLGAVVSVVLLDDTGGETTGRAVMMGLMFFAIRSTPSIMDWLDLRRKRRLERWMHGE